MISNSVGAVRRASTNSSKICPTNDGAPRARGSVRLVPPIGNNDENSQVQQDEETPLGDVDKGDKGERTSRVMRATRRRSSINRTRESILRILRDQKTSAAGPVVGTNNRATTIVDTLLSPTDWLTSPMDAPSDDRLISDAWARKSELESRSAKPWYVVLPHSRFRLVWDAVLSILLSIMAFYSE